MHIFPYSKRNGTAAEKFKNVAKNVAQRVKDVSEVARQMKADFISKNIGLTHEVIIENQKEGYYLAHTKNFILCYIKSKTELLSNQKFNVRLVKSFADGAIAEII